MGASRRPQDSDFYQQRLKAWQPILTPKWVVITFLCIGIPFVGIGFWLKAASDKVVEYRVPYDGKDPVAPAQAACQLTASQPAGSCLISFTVADTLKAPVFLYYELHNFYQNHRRYVKSRVDAQLAGTIYTTAGQVPDCAPLQTAADGRLLDPCGLVANSYFNDTFSLLPVPSAPSLFMSETGIAWDADIKRFKGWTPEQQAANEAAVKFINETYPGVQDVTNEHFIVWMRPAALPNFRKLYGRFDADIPAGTTLTFNVSSIFPVTGFAGTKALVLSTTSVVGGKNPFLGIAYIVVGFVAIGLAAAFAARAYFGGRRLGDTSYLVWSGGSGGRR